MARKILLRKKNWSYRLRKIRAFLTSISYTNENPCVRNRLSKNNIGAQLHLIYIRHSWKHDFKNPPLIQLSEGSVAWTEWRDECYPGSAAGCTIQICSNDNGVLALAERFEAQGYQNCPNTETFCHNSWSNTARICKFICCCPWETSP